MKIAYCGIDVGLKNHTICLMDEKQSIVKKYSISNDREGFQKLEYDIDKNTKICLEPTGVYSINIFLYFKNRGYDIKFCKTDSSFSFRQARFAKKKHDMLDCISLAKYRIVNDDLTSDGSRIIEKLALNNYVYNPECLILSELLDKYMKKVNRVAVLKNKIKNIIDLRFPEAIQIFPADRSCKTILKVLSYSKEDILAGKIKLQRFKQIQEKLRYSIGQYNLKISEFESYVKEKEETESQIKELKTEIKAQLCKIGYSSLFDYCGLNTISIAILVAEIRDITRFYRYSQNGCFNKKRSLKAFKKFMGIATTSNQSGQHQGVRILAKIGNMKLRSIIFLQALGYLSRNPKEEFIQSENLNPHKFKEMYERLVEKGHKKLIAITKVMNKIVTDMFFIFKEIAERDRKESN